MSFLAHVHLDLVPDSSPIVVVVVDLVADLVVDLDCPSPGAERSWRFDKKTSRSTSMSTSRNELPA